MRGRAAGGERGKGRRPTEACICWIASPRRVSGRRVTDDWGIPEPLRERKTRRLSLYAAGNPKKIYFDLPMELPVVRSSDLARIPLPDYEAELRTDASYDYNSRVAGVAWQLVVGGVEGPIRIAKKRYGKGPVFSEMTAIRLGLEEARKRGIRRLILRTDSQWSAHALLGIVTPQLPYMVKVCQPALEAAVTFESLAIVHTRTKNIRAIDKKARKAADGEAQRVRSVEVAREARVLEAMDRARGVKLVREGDAWIADGHVRVTLSPPSCACRGWTLRWAKVPIEGKRSRRIPCKHLTAVALLNGLTLPSELLQLARRAVD